jgi:outer membrane protein assembly factor BamB
MGSLLHTPERILFMLHSIGLLTVAFMCSSAIAQPESTDGSSVPASGPGITPLDGGAIWTHFGGNARHQSRAPAGTASPSLITPAWIGAGDGTATYIPIPQTGLVVDFKRVYTLAGDPVQPGAAFAVAYDRITGGFLWSTPVPPAILDSWSTPAIDIEHKQLIVVTGQTITALDENTGTLNWSTDIGAIVVNSSPIVTTDLGVRDRLFVTNYSFGGGSSAVLTCINVDPFDSNQNPFQPGEIIWQTQLNGQSAGNTPAYSAGTVFVATASSPGSNAGQILAFDATTDDAPSPTWTFTNTINAGFFSGVSIARGHVYASSFSFSGLQLNSNTVKVNKQTGQLVWSVPTNRTDATPIPLSNGDVVVSGGIAIGAFDFLPFFGSLPSIEYIADAGSSATLLWDSALDTLDDTNNNGIWDFGESFLSIGGWTHQPISFTTGSTPMLLVGTLAETNPGVLFGHNTDIQLVDLTKAPTESGFLTEHYNGAGATPAIVGSWIYTSGAGGVYAFAPQSPPVTPTEILNLYLDGRITFEQLFEHLRR